MEIDATFDGGSILVLDEEEAGGGGEVPLELRADNATDLRQWFCFRVSGEPGERQAFRIENAGAAEYPAGWEDYRVCASYDGEDWFRVPTRYDGGVLSFRHTPVRRSLTYACFAPYPYSRHRRLIGRAARSRIARVEVLGHSVQGRPISAITFGQRSASSLRVWMIARQHPGETMAEWCAEGIVHRLLDERDPVSAALREDAEITVVPCVNLDGGVLGNHRTNAAGRDLNRSWDAPDPVQSPEVLAIRSAILESGADMFLDIHGDEALPYAFAAGCEGNPGYDDRLANLETEFLAQLEAADPAFQTEKGYDPDPPGEADLFCAANWVSERFDCLAFTLEMPFKDDANHPDRRRGWSPGKSEAFGRSLLEAVLLTLPSLR
jgi:murein tripeptide amidase MpaA